MEIFFEKQGNGQGRPSKLVRLENGNVMSYKEWNAIQITERKKGRADNKAAILQEKAIKREAKKLAREAKQANKLAELIEKEKAKEAPLVEVSQSAEIIHEEPLDPILEIDTSTCSDEDFNAFIVAHKKTIKHNGKKPANQIY